MSHTIAATTTDPTIERYRHAEEAVWRKQGLDPLERLIELEAPRVRLRVQETGTGEPVLFIHGTDGPGAWPALLRELPDLRCIVLDRPGWGMSSPIDFAKGHYGTLIADLLVGVLDSLGIERAHIVGGSIGDLWALRLAQRHPARVGATVLLGGGPIVADVGLPGIIRVISSPLGALMVRLPSGPDRVRSILRDSGHAATVDEGRIPEGYIDWRVAAAGAMRHERAMIRAIVSWRTGYRHGVTFRDDELAAITRPVLHVVGTTDPVGTPDAWRRVATRLQHGQVRVLDGAGHMPWFEAPTDVAAAIRGAISQASAGGPS